MPQLASGERKSSRLPGQKGRRWGVLVGALFFIGLALAGAGWFFKDQVKTFLNRTLPHKGSDDADALDPAVVAVLNQQKQKLKTAAETTPAKKEGAAAKSAPAPAPATASTKTPKARGGDSVASTGKGAASKAATPPAAPPQPPAGESPKKPADTPPVVASTVEIAPPPAPPAVQPNKPEAPKTLVESPKNPEAPSPTSSEETSVKRALPIDSHEFPTRRAKDPLPETLGPIPPMPPTPSSPGLVEVAASAKENLTSALPAGEEKPVFIKANAEARPAADTLNKFFHAKNWEERLTFTQPQEKVRPLMERYYASNPDGPIRVGSIELIRHEKTPEIGTPLCVFQVSGPDLPEPLPVMVESSHDGWKVDWLTFTEFKDKLLLRFLQKWQDEPARFHVMVRRTHYFDEDVPNLEKRHCFELMPPTPGYSGFAFVSKGSALAQSLDRTIGWEIANVAAIVELQWRKQDRYQWVEITAVPQFNWRTMTAIPVAQPAKLAPDEGNGAIPAKPAVKAAAVVEKK